MNMTGKRESSGIEGEFSRLIRQGPENIVSSVLTQLDAGIAVYDREMRYLYWNGFMERLTLKPAAEVIGKVALDLFPHLRDQGVDRLLYRTLAGERVTSGDIPFHVRETGRSGWVTGSYSPLHDDRGQVIGVIGVIHDITAQKAVEKELARQYNFILTAINSLPYPFSVIDMATHKIVMANSRLGAEKDWQGRTCHEVTHHSPVPCSSVSHSCPLKMVKATGRPVMVEHLHYDQEGNQKHVEVHGYPIFDEAGNLSQMIEYAVDITERKKLEAEREKLIAELQEALAQIKTLSGIVPICMYCKQIRDDQGYWNQLEKFISEHSEAQFSHGICPKCYEERCGKGGRTG